MDYDIEDIDIREESTVVDVYPEIQVVIMGWKGNVLEESFRGCSCSRRGSRGEFNYSRAAQTLDSHIWLLSQFCRWRVYESQSCDLSSDL